MMATNSSLGVDLPAFQLLRKYEVRELSGAARRAKGWKWCMVQVMVHGESWSLNPSWIHDLVALTMLNFIHHHGDQGLDGESEWWMMVADGLQ